MDQEIVQIGLRLFVSALVGAVILKSGYDVKGIKAVAAIWITGAAGLAIATSYWRLGLSPATGSPASSSRPSPTFRTTPRRTASVE